MTTFETVPGSTPEGVGDSVNEIVSEMNRVLSLTPEQVDSIFQERSDDKNEKPFNHIKNEVERQFLTKSHAVTEVLKQAQGKGYDEGYLYADGLLEEGEETFSREVIFPPRRESTIKDEELVVDENLGVFQNKIYPDSRNIPQRAKAIVYLHDKGIGNMGDYIKESVEDLVKRGKQEGFFYRMESTFENGKYQVSDEVKSRLESGGLVFDFDQDNYPWVHFK